MAEGLPGRPYDALSGSHFAIECDGVVLTQFQEVSGITQEREVTTLKQNASDGSLIIQQLPGPWKPPTITLKRAANQDKSMADWYDQARTDISGARRSGSVIAFDEAGGEIARWNFLAAWISKLEVTGLKAAANEVAIETATLTAQQIERVK